MNSDMILWSPGVSLEQIEKEVILKAFRFYRGNKTTTSQALGISIRTLDNKLEKYEADGIEQRRRDELDRQKRQEYSDRSRGILPAQPGAGAPAEQGSARPSVLPRADAGVRVESASQASAQSAVPVPESKKIQTVLPSQAAKSGQERRR